MSDKVTIVSVFPKELDERKPGINPGQFKIPAAPMNGHSSVVVGPAYYWVTFIEMERKPIRVEIKADEVAASIVNDYIRNIPGYNPVLDAMPGFFIIPSEVKNEAIEKGFPSELKDARARQNRWFKNLVIEADDLWEKSRQHRLINSLARLACKALGFEREWLIELQSETGPKFCDACRVRVHPEAVICPSCSYVLNAEKYSKMTFARTKEK